MKSVWTPILVVGIPLLINASFVVTAKLENNPYQTYYAFGWLFAGMLFSMSLLIWMKE